MDAGQDHLDALCRPFHQVDDGSLGAESWECGDFDDAQTLELRLSYVIDPEPMKNDVNAPAEES